MRTLSRPRLAMPAAALAAALALGGSPRASAIDYSGIVSAGTGYLSSFSDVAIGFYGYGGETLAFTMEPFGSAAVQGYCGLSSFITDQVLFSHFSWQRVYYTLPVSDLYVYLCIDSGYAAGEALLYVAAPWAFSADAAAGTGKQLAPAVKDTSANPVLQEALRAALEAKLKAISP
ncbi:MAG TPA: hypothetical protein VNN09_02845 [Candidatus Competibacteraceae bacterium]|nr:hypothetical protein [Candidatus Competibacteraceae bacterium]